MENIFEEEVEERITNHDEKRSLTPRLKNVMLDELSSEINISKKMIYSLFSNKKDLLKTIIWALECRTM